MFKILALFALVAVANAGYLGSAGLEVAAPEQAIYHAPAPAVYHAPAPIAYKSIVSPAVTKTDFIPGSYSSSYRSDVITPRVQYSETPGYSYAVPQPPAIGYAPTVTKVAHLEPVVQRYAHIAPAPLIPTAPLAHTEFLGHGLGYAGLGSYAGLGNYAGLNSYAGLGGYADLGRYAGLSSYAGYPIKDFGGHYGGYKKFLH